MKNREIIISSIISMINKLPDKTLDVVYTFIMRIRWRMVEQEARGD